MREMSEPMPAYDRATEKELRAEVEVEEPDRFFFFLGFRSISSFSTDELREELRGGAGKGLYDGGIGDVERGMSAALMVKDERDEVGECLKGGVVAGVSTSAGR